MNRAERAGLVWPQLDQHFRAGNFAQPLRPAILQVPQPREFSLRAHLLVELERLQRRVVHRRRMRADFFELANVLVHPLWRGHQRPMLLDAVFAHVQHASANGGGEPLVQARAVEIAVHVRKLERHVRERVRSVHDAGDAPRARQRANLPDGHNLARHEHHVGHVNHARARRDSLLEHPHQVRGVAHRHGVIQLLEHDFFAPLALLPSGNHARIVLAGRQDFVAGLQVQAKLRDLQRLAGVARDGNGLGIGVPHQREFLAHVFDSRLQVVPHAVRRKLIAVADGIDLRFQHAVRRRRHPAIIEVDELGIARVRVANFLPVFFVTGQILRRDVRVGVVQHGGKNHGLRPTQKIASTHSCAMERITTAHFPAHAHFTVHL